MKLFKKKCFEEILLIKDDIVKINEIYTYLSKKCKYGQNLEMLECAEKFLFLAMDFENYILDGGIEQFLYNVPYDILDTSEAFDMLKREDIKLVIEKTISIFPLNIIPKDRKERISLMENLLTAGDVFEDINNEIRLDLMDNYIDYINKNFGNNL